MRDTGSPGSRCSTRRFQAATPPAPSARGRGALGSPALPVPPRRRVTLPPSSPLTWKLLLRVLCVRVVWQRPCLGAFVACYLNLADLRLLKRSRYLHRLLQLKLLEGWGRSCACRVAFGGEQLFPSSRRNSVSCSGEDALLPGSFACQGARGRPVKTWGSCETSKPWRCHLLQSSR